MNHPHSPTLLERFSGGLEGERPELVSPEAVIPWERQRGLKWSSGGGNGEKCGCSVGGAEGPQRHVTTSLGCPVWSETNPQGKQWRKGPDEGLGLWPRPWKSVSRSGSCSFQ